MSALGEALPLALSAAFYPPALLVLLLLITGSRPRRLVLAYFAGAAIITVSAGLIALTALQGASLTTQDSPTASAWAYIALGLLLLALAAWAWKRRARDPSEPPLDAETSPGRISQWSQRATSSQKWAFALGLAMYLPSPLYLLAIKDIADSGDSSSSNVLAVVICAATVLLFIEIPLIALFIRPGGVAAGIQRFHGWLKRNGWTLAAVLALAGGIDAMIKGVQALS
jgi:Sap-like sulfolipid-1-addressing protein